MFPSEEFVKLGLESFPRVRGDVPCPSPRSSSRSEFSPRARGCSAREAKKQLREIVFPACAGMFLRPREGQTDLFGFPRVRGDVPWLPALPP